MHCAPVALLAATLLAQGCAAQAGGIAAAPEGPPAEPRSPLARILHRPLRVTTGTGSDFQPAPAPDDDRIAYVSDASGNLDIWILDLASGPGASPIQVTDHTATDMEPAWGPDGRRIAFASRRSDPEGDIWVFTFPRLAFLSLVLEKPLPLLSESLRRLTDQTSADRQPAWSPDGDSIAFTSRPHGEGKAAVENLWRIDLDSGDRTRVTRDGGRDPAWSPDGAFIAFSAERKGMEGGGSDLMVVRLSDGREAPLTAGPPLDLLPAWSDGGDTLFFSRYAEDTNADGRITPQDRPSLWKLRFDPEAAFASGEPRLAEPEPLTEGASSDLFAAARGPAVYFSSDRGEDLDVWAVRQDGIVEDMPSAPAQMRAAEEIDRYETVDPRTKALAYRKVAARFPAADPSLLARALYRVGEIQIELGNRPQARDEFASLARRVGAGGAVEEAILARIQLIRIAREEAVERFSSPTEKLRLTEALERGIAELTALSPGEIARRPGALALVELGNHWLALGNDLHALDAYDEVETGYEGESEAAAEAAYRKGDVYERLRDREGLLTSALAVLTKHAASPRWSAKAAERAVAAILGDEEGLSPDEKADRLRRIADEQSERPLLAALALRRLGDFLVDRGETAQAEAALARVVSEFPSARDEVSRARFALARIAYAQGRYEECLALYRQIEKSHPEVERAYALARSSYVRRSLDKARHEMDGRDPDAAAATLISLLEYDYEVPEAHRALIRAFHVRGRDAEIVDHYRGELKRRPGEAIPWLGLGYALTYFEEPKHFDEAAGALRRAIAIEPRLPHPHLTLGFLYEYEGRKAGAEEGDPEGRRWIGRALGEYETTLSLTDAAEDPSLAADLALNLGNVHFLLGNYRRAHEFYARREKSGFAFETLGQQANYEKQYGETLLKLERFAEAVPHYQAAREIFAREEGREGVLYEIADSLGLCYQQMRRHGDAAASYREALAWSRKLGNVENAYRAMRNLAVSLTFEGAPGGGGEIDPEKLEEALAGYATGLEALEGRRGAVAARGAGRAPPAGGLVSKTVAIGGQGSEAAFGFGREGEKKLIFSFVARILAEAGDHEGAARFLEKKLTLIPEEEEEGGDKAFLQTDRAVVLNQLAGLYEKLGRRAEAFAKLLASLELAIRAESAEGMLKDAEGLAHLAAEDREDGEIAVDSIEAAARLSAAAAARVTEETPRDLPRRVALANARAVLLREGVLRSSSAAQSSSRGGESVEASVRASLDSLRADAARLGEAGRLLAEAFGLAAEMEGVEGAKWKALLAANLSTLGPWAGVEGEAAEKVHAIGLEAATQAGLGGLRWVLLAAHGDLEEAARALEAIPPGTYEGFGREARGRILALYGALAERALASGDAAGALAAAERAGGLVRIHALAPEVASRFSSEPANPAEVQALVEPDAIALVFFPSAGKTLGFLIAPDAIEGKSLAIDEGSDLAEIAEALDVAFGERLGAAARIYVSAAGPLARVEWERVPWKRAAPGTEVARLAGLGHFLAAYEKRGLLETERLIFGEAGGDAAGAPPSGHTTVLRGAEATRASFLKTAGSFHVIRIESPLRWDPRTPWLSPFDLPGGERVNNLRIEDVASLSGDFARLEIPGVPREERDPIAEEVSVRLLASAGFPTVVLGGVGGSAPRTWGLLPMRPDEAALFAETNYDETLAAGVAAFKAGDQARAARALEKALALNRVVEREAEREKILNALTEALARSGDFARAADYQGEAVEWARSGPRKGDGGALAEALYHEGVFLSRAERFGQAAHALAESVALYRTLGDPGREAKARATLGIVEEGGGRYESALEQFSTALEIERREGSVEGIAKQLRRIGRIHLVRLNNTVEAMRAFGEARAEAERAGAEEDWIQATLEIGLAHEALGDFERALAFYGEGREAAEAVGDKLALSQSAIYEAQAYWLMGDYGRAFEREREAVGIAEEIPDRYQIYMGENLLSVLYWTLNDFEKALEHAGRALEEAAGLGARQEVSTVHNNIGIIHREAGRYEEALSALEEALAIDREIRSRWGEAYDLRNIGMTYLRMKRVPEAIENLTAALEMSRAIGDRTNAAKALLSLGDARREAGDLDQAARAYAGALEDARAGALKEVEWRALWGEGRLARARGDGERARASLEAAVQVVERMRAAIGIEEFKNGFVENKTELYEDLIELLLDQGQVEEAFAYAERSRARSFIDLLGNQRLRLESEASQGLLDREKAVEGEIDLTEKALAEAGGPDTPAGKALAEKLARLGTDRDELLLEIKLKNPQISSFVTVEPLGVKELWDLLDLGVVLLEYFLAKEEVVCFVVRKGSLDVVRTKASRADLEEKITRLRALIQGIEPVEALSRDLYDILVRPAGRFVRPGDVVGIVPHGALHYLSFAALNDGERYMLEKHALFHAPSASVLRFTLAPPRPREGLKILGVGNPDLGASDLDLPFAEKEVSRIHWSFPEVTVLTRDKATESWVAENIGKFDVIHFAAHGEFDPVNPLASALKLSADAKSDGDLSAREVFSIRANAELVTLSACQSGLGKIRKGDEVIGLSRAFLYAGTSSLVSSLWRVSDASTGMLIKSFYRELVTRSKADSLRRAALHVKQYYPHPTYWAGFALTGDYH